MLYKYNDVYELSDEKISEILNLIDTDEETYLLRLRKFTEDNFPQYLKDGGYELGEVTFNYLEFASYKRIPIVYRNLTSGLRFEIGYVYGETSVDFNKENAEAEYYKLIAMLLSDKEWILKMSTYIEGILKVVSELRINKELVMRVKSDKAEDRLIDILRAETDKLTAELKAADKNSYVCVTKCDNVHCVRFLYRGTAVELVSTASGTFITDNPSDFISSMRNKIVHVSALKSISDGTWINH